ncbi:MAG: hypothetical protein R3266_14215 [Gemmatimonadota bacterium]|nr:hypothetical protein [Gemmatimonadota bacterium]
MSEPLPQVLSSVALAGLLAGCVVARVEDEPARRPPTEPDHAHAAIYHVSCSVSDECRVTYLDEDGELEAKDVTGEWTRAFGADPGRRLWLRAGAGGCPPRPVRVEIRVDGRTVAERLVRPPGGWQCEWILAETEFEVP